jgi:hypothetical protein
VIAVQPSPGAGFQLLTEHEGRFDSPEEARVLGEVRLIATRLPPREVRRLPPRAPGGVQRAADLNRFGKEFPTSYLAEREGFEPSVFSDFSMAYEGIMSRSCLIDTEQ